MKYSKVKIPLLILFSFVVGVSIGYLQATHPIAFIKQTAQQNDKTRLIAFQSKRVPFGFTHPANFPVTSLSDQFVYQFDNSVESINLGTLDNTPNAGGPAEGYIIVERYNLDNVTPEQRLLKENADRIKGLKTVFKNYTEPTPVITKVMLGNGEAYQITTKPGQELGGDLAPVATTYYIERGGLRYIIGITPHNPERAKQLQTLLQTLHFDY